MSSLQKAMNNSYFTLLDDLENPKISLFGRRLIEKQSNEFEYTIVCYTGSNLIDCDMVKLRSFEEMKHWLDENYDGGFAKIENIYMKEVSKCPGLDNNTCCTCKNIRLEDDLVTETCIEHGMQIHSRLTERCECFS